MLSTFFTILFFITLFFMLWGVISPTSLSNQGKNKKPITRKDSFIGFGIIALVLFVFVGITAPDTAKNVQVEHASTTKEEQKSAPITKTITETVEIPFEKTTTNDGALLQGSSKTITQGVNGIKTLTYEITLVDGRQTDKKLIKEEITIQPITEVTAVGTKVKTQSSPRPATTQSCDPNYSGACVPIASDVDCGSGSGNGPAYVYGTVRVIGTDIYGLDRDGDGYGCE